MFTKMSFAHTRLCAACMHKLPAKPSLRDYLSSVATTVANINRFGIVVVIMDVR